MCTTCNTCIKINIESWTLSIHLQSDFNCIWQSILNRFYLSCNKHFSLADVDFHDKLQRVACIVTTLVNRLEFWDRIVGKTSCWWWKGPVLDSALSQMMYPLPSQNVWIYCYMRLAYRQECCLYTCALHYHTKLRFLPNFFFEKETDQIKFSSIIKNACI